MIKAIFLSILFVFSFLLANAQEKEFKRHSAVLVMSHTYVPEGRQSWGSKDLLIIPSIGIDYNFKFNQNWGLGFQYDIEFMNYVLEYEEDTFLTRKNPMILALLAERKVWKELTIGIGGGYEIEKSKNLILLRFTAEYEYETKNDIVFGPNISFDYKDINTTAFAFGLFIGKKF
ncbi:MAG: hypothetical protein ACPGEG_04165 [Salibacteraceae bacterium]